MIDLKYIYIDSDNIERRTLSIDTAGKLKFTNGVEHVKQNIVIYMSTLIQEFFYNENKGVDLISMTNEQPASLSIYIMSALQDVRGVKTVLDCKIYNNEQRTYTIIASLETDDSDYITIGYTV